MRADRLVSMVMLLQTRGKMTAKALAEMLEVSPRTILRDVEALSIAGIPIYAEGGHGGGIALDENYRTTLTGLKDSEVRALFIASNNDALREIGLGEAAESTHLKLTASLPVQHQISVNHIRQRIYIDPTWWWHEKEQHAFWSDLQTAVYEDRVIDARYEHYDGELVERRLEPYSLVAKSSLWYLVAKHKGSLRTYRVSRFHSITLLDTPFVRDNDFDLATYWQSHLDEFISAFSGYSITLRVHEDKLNFVRWLLPGRMSVIETDADGWHVVRIQMESETMAKMLVFGLGKQGEVLDPIALKQALYDAIREWVDAWKEG